MSNRPKNVEKKDFPNQQLCNSCSLPRPFFFFDFRRFVSLPSNLLLFQDSDWLPKFETLLDFLDHITEGPNVVNRSILHPAFMYDIQFIESIILKSIYRPTHSPAPSRQS
jgi:hypothetical protein